MKEIIYRSVYHHVLFNGINYQVLTRFTNYSCGYYESKKQAVKRADELSIRRMKHDKMKVGVNNDQI